MQTIVQRLHITKAGEQHYFQINVPRQATSITGIELGVVMNTNVFLRDKSLSSNNWLSIKRNKLLGEVQLQTSNPSNFFYRGELIQEDNNVGVTDFVQPTNDIEELDVQPFPKQSILDAIEFNLHFERKRPFRNYWKSHQFTHGNKKEFDAINIANETVIYGCFKDVIGTIEKKNISYIVQVFLMVSE